MNICEYNEFLVFHCIGSVWLRVLKLLSDENDYDIPETFRVYNEIME